MYADLVYIYFSIVLYIFLYLGMRALHLYDLSFTLWLPDYLLLCFVFAFTKVARPETNLSPIPRLSVPFLLDNMCFILLPHIQDIPKVISDACFFVSFHFVFAEIKEFILKKEKKGLWQANICEE